MGSKPLRTEYHCREDAEVAAEAAASALAEGEEIHVNSGMDDRSLSDR